MSQIENFLNENKDCFEPIMISVPENCAECLHIHTGHIVHVYFDKFGNVNWEVTSYGSN